MKDIKNRKTVVMLLGLVVILWGGIVWRLFSYTGEKKNVAQETKKCFPAVSFVTGSLSFAYRDPFTESLPVVPAVVTSVRPAFISPLQSLPSNPSFRLRGKIRKGKKDFLLLGYPDGHILVWGEGKIDGYKVRSIYDDSVVVVKHGRSYTLLIN